MIVEVRRVYPADLKVHTPAVNAVRAEEAYSDPTSLFDYRHREKDYQQYA